jgi:hypothetical protein
VKVSTSAIRANAELLRLAQAFEHAQSRVDAAEAVLTAMSKTDKEGLREVERQFDELCRELFRIREAIRGLPARTPDGLAVKARLAARYFQAPGEEYTFERLAGSLVSDVVRLTQAARPELLGSVVQRRAARGSALAHR